MILHHIVSPQPVAGDIAAERVALRQLRAGIMATIEADLARIDRMIRAVDLIDGDADFEPDAGQERDDDFEDTRGEQEDGHQPLVMPGGGYSRDAFA